MVEVVNVGMGNDEEEKHSFFLPYGKKEKIIEQLRILLPEFEIAFEAKNEKQPRGVFAVWTANAMMWLGILIPVAAIAAEFMEAGIGMVIVVAIVILAYIVILRTTAYMTDSVVVGEEFLQISQGHFSRYFLFTKYDKIQFLTMKQCVVAKKCGIEKGEIHLLASMKNQIHNLPYMKEEQVEGLIKLVKSAKI